MWAEAGGETAAAERAPAGADDAATLDVTEPVVPAVLAPIVVLATIPLATGMGPVPMVAADAPCWPALRATVAGVVLVREEPGCPSAVVRIFLAAAAGEVLPPTGPDFETAPTEAFPRLEAAVLPPAAGGTETGTGTGTVPGAAGRVEGAAVSAEERLNGAVPGWDLARRGDGRPPPAAGSAGVVARRGLVVVTACFPSGT